MTHAAEHAEWSIPSRQRRARFVDDHVGVRVGAGRLHPSTRFHQGRSDAGSEL